MTFGLWSAVPPTLPPSACADALPGRDAAGGNICRDQPAPSVATQAACCAACDASVNCEVWRFDPAPTAAQPCTLLFGVSSTVAAKDPGTVIGGSGVAPPPAPPAGESSTVWTALGYAADVYLSPLAGELILCTVTFRANPAHSLTRSPCHIFDGQQVSMRLSLRRLARRQRPRRRRRAGPAPPRSATTPLRRSTTSQGTRTCLRSTPLDSWRATGDGSTPPT